MVRKLVLTDDGSIDIGVSHFIAWAIRIVASTMILQSTVDILLAAEALVCGILVSSILRRIFHLKFIRLIYKKSSRMIGNICEILLDLFTPTYNESYPRPPSNGSTSESPKPLSDSDTFYSSYHKTPERRKISKGDLEKLTQQTTKRAMEELVASPDFSRWAVAHADRITLAVGTQKSYYT